MCRCMSPFLPAPTEWAQAGGQVYGNAVTFGVNRPTGQGPVTLTFLPHINR